MSQHLHIQQAQLIDPANNIDTVTDIYIIDDKIAGIGQAPEHFSASKQIDATGLIACPGLVDICARLREPGEGYKAKLNSELKAAVAGGVTSLACPPDTDPVLDEPGLVEMLKHRTKELNLAKVYPIGALTQQLAGKQLAEMHELSHAGCVGFSQADQAISNTQILWRAFQYAATFDLTVFLRAEDPYLAEDGVAHDGEIATRLGLKGIPRQAETLALSALLQIAHATQAKLHISQLSTAAGIELIRQAKSEGQQISCDVDIAHLHLTEHDIGYFNTACHLRPPLRTQRDKAAITAGLKDGTIDIICSNHAPTDEDDKLVPFAQSTVGATGIELLLPLVLKWAATESIPFPEALAYITCNAAKVLAIDAGTLSIGSAADICLFHPDTFSTIEASMLHSEGKTTPFEQVTITTKTMITIVDGAIVFQA